MNTRFSNFIYSDREVIIIKIRIYAVGGKLEKFYLESIKEYQKRLNRYCNIQFSHLKKESDLQNKLNPNTFVFAISISGKCISSEELAHKLDHKATSGVSDISIVIGVNPLKHNEVLTLSQMDMDFGLQTTVLFEQVYRAYRIINNHPYHK